MLRRAAITASIATGCGSSPGPADAAAAIWERGVELVEPVANNAVAALETASGCMLVTALGIDGSRTAAGIHTRSWTFDGVWAALPDLPGPGRIAASAVALRGRVYVLGGYSVAGGGAETSHTSVDVLDLEARSWTPGPSIPIPIDDAVAVAWRDRWIVVASGWSNTAPVADVQIFDVETATWSSATPFPGTPVFGHAGGIVGDDLVIIDGVARTNLGGFRPEHQSWRARLDPADPTKLTWSRLGDHPGPPRYRAAGGNRGSSVIIHGGTAEPYNFDGLTYATGAPAPPLPDAVAFDVVDGSWVEPPPLKQPATMDHRALVGCGARLITVGGLEAGPAVTSAVWELGAS